MSAIESDLGPDPSPPVDKRQFAAQLRPVLEALAAARGMSLEELAAAAGIARSTFYDRLEKGNFSALDFRMIAAALRVDVDTLYLSADELMGVLRSGSFSPVLRGLDILTGQGTLLDPDLSPLDFFSRPDLVSV